MFVNICSGEALLSYGSLFMDNGGEHKLTMKMVDGYKDVIVGDHV